jgi:signal transduction histidine kinase
VVDVTSLSGTRSANAWSSILFVALALAFIVASIVGAPHPRHASAWLACDVVIICWGVVGVLFARQSSPLGRLISLGSLAAALAAWGARVAVTQHPGTHDTYQVVAALAAPLAMAIALHVFLALPTGVLVTQTRRFVASVWYAAALGVGIVVATSTHSFVPWGVYLGWLLALLGSLPNLYGRYTVASAIGRQRLQCLAIGLALALVVALVTVALHWLTAWPSMMGVALLAASALVPVALIVSVASVATHADRVLVHVLSILGLTVVVVAVYLVALRGIGKSPQDTAEREILGWSIAAAGGAAVIYLMIRDRFARLATGLTYGAREAPDEVVRTFGSRLTRAIPMDELLLQLVESLRKTLALTSAEIYTGTGEVLELAVSVPDIPKRSVSVSGDERDVIARAGVSGNAWASVWIPGIIAGRSDGPLRVAPISHAGELLGVIVISRGEGAVGFREEDDRVLTELARQVGLAMHNAQLDTALQSSLDELRRQADELRASRARIVASGDAERRRVERNLHDGAQQHLVALAINLRLAKDVVTEDPQAAVEMLDELGVAVQDTIKELRELAHGIYPPLLVDSGLGEALRAVANRSPLAVDLQAEGIGRYSRDVEAAIYFCCLEALQNAGKHAPESHVTIRIWEESGGLLFEVSDDGPGFDASAARRGHGYVNMMDRLGAIGGAVRWESEVGVGSTIRGSVPLS